MTLLLLLLGVALFYFLPWPLALLLFSPFLAAFLFLTWRLIQSMRQPPITGTPAMLGKEAVVVRSEPGHLEVRYQGLTWNAVSSASLQRDQQVIIRDVQGLTLLVTPLAQPGGREPEASP